MVVVLCTSSYDAYGNTWMKFYEHFLTETATYKVHRAVTQKVSTQELWFLHSACRLMLVNICM